VQQNRPHSTQTNKLRNTERSSR